VWSRSSSLVVVLGIVTEKRHTLPRERRQRDRLERDDDVLIVADDAELVGRVPTLSR
jgi:hypothetical protein